MLAPVILPLALYLACISQWSLDLLAGSVPASFASTAREELLASGFGLAFQLPFCSDTHNQQKDALLGQLLQLEARTSVSGDDLEESMVVFHIFNLQEAEMLLKYLL